MKIIDICREAAKAALRGLAAALGEPITAAEAKQFIGALSDTVRFSALRITNDLFLAVRCDPTVATIVLLFSGTKAALGEKPTRCLRAIHAEFSRPDSPIRQYAKANVFLKHRTDVSEAEFQSLQERYARATRTTP